MVELKNIIFKREILKQGSYTEANDAFHIAFGIDFNFVMGMGILMSSILRNNPKKSFTFHVFTDEIANEDIPRLEELTKEFPRTVIKIYYLDKTRLAALPTGFTWTAAIYYRFIISDELQGVVKKVLYLDSDVLCIREIGELTMGQDCIVSAVEDKEAPAERIKKLFPSTETAVHYFFSGILYIDIDKWQEHDITRRAVELLSEENDAYQFYDQDVLNQLLHGYTHYWQEAYNYVYNLAFMKKEIPTDVVFVHYAGSAKPWQKWAQGSKAADLYIEYKNHSPWANVEIEVPKTYKQAKFMARAYKREKKYILAIRWYLNYSLWKMTRK